MEKNSQEILKSIQKNTEMAMKAIETIEPKVQNEEMAKLLAKTSRKYSAIHGQAVEQMVEGGVQPEKTGGFSQMMLVGGITGNTLLNTSTSHLAELMIKGSNMGITDLNKTLNHYGQGEEKAKKLAEDLLELEKYNLEEYKKYL